MSGQKRDDRERAQERAEANFKRKDVQNREASKAWAEYEASRDAEREKTARLKQLRLAKQSADAAAKGTGNVAKAGGVSSSAADRPRDSALEVAETVRRPKATSAAGAGQRAPAKKSSTEDSNATKKPAQKPARVGAGQGG